VGDIFSDFFLPYPSVIILVEEQESNVPRDRYVTDIYIRLWQGTKEDVRIERYCERYIEVVKAANCPHVRGPQLFRICPDSGIELLPSLPASVQLFQRAFRKRATSADSQPRKQHAFGISEIGNDDRIYKGSSTALVGPPASYKTPLALLFCKKSLQTPNGKAVILSLHERPYVACEYAKKLGLLELIQEDEFVFTESQAFEVRDVKPHHRFAIRHLSSAFMPPEAFIAMIRHILKALKHDPESDTRFVIDSISDLYMNYPRLTAVEGFLSVLLNTLYGENVTSLLLFNERDYDSVAGKVIVDLADNSYNLHKLIFRGEPHILLQPQQTAGRLIGTQNLYRLIWDEDAQDIKAEDVKSQFYIEAGNVEPVKRLAYLSKCTKSLGKINEIVCSVYNASIVDEELVHEPVDCISEVVKRLCTRKDAVIMMAVDTAYLNSTIIEHFTPIDIGKEEAAFVNISAQHERKKLRDLKPLDICRDRYEGKLRALPLYIDCSLVLCNLDILSLASEHSKILKKIETKVRNSMVLGNDDKLNLPEIGLDSFREAAKDFWDEDTMISNGLYFFGFQSGPNPEALVCMFFDWLTANGISLYQPTAKGRRRGLADQIDKWKKALLDFVELYLPTEQAKMKLMKKSKDRQDKDVGHLAHNCLFIHTWHSLACSKSMPVYCVPVKIGPRWRSTRGGWCWGIIDNGLAGPRIHEMLRFATGSPINSYLVNNNLALPPRREFCRETGILSIYNLGLMKKIVEEEGWSRANIIDYTHLSSYAYRYFHEFFTQVERLGIASPNNLTIIRKWLESTLQDILSGISASPRWA